MTNELRAMAERLIERNQFQSSGDARDACLVAEAYLAEHPADDGAPVIPEWLESLGYADSMGMLYEKRYELCNSVRIMFFAREHPQRWAPAIWVGGGQCHVKSNPTRGDVRRLLAALGITPK